MPTVLIIEDAAGKGESIAAEIVNAEKEGEFTKPTEVNLVLGGDVQDISEALIEIFSADDRVWDAIILDVDFPRDKFGGIKVYNNLVARRKRNRWNHTIVCTKWMMENSDHGLTGQDIVEMFAMTVFIPPRFLLDSRAAQRNRKIIDLLKEIETLGAPSRCAGCSRPL